MMRTESPAPGLMEAIRHLRARQSGLVVSNPPPCPTLAHVQHVFGLTAFESDLLLDLAARELDPQPASHLNMTFRRAMAEFADAHWNAFIPDAPLRRWSLIEIVEGPTFLDSEIRIKERTLHALAGVNYLDPLVEPFLRLAPIAAGVGAEARLVAQRWADESESRTVFHLIGEGNGERFAAQAATALGLRLAVVDESFCELVDARIWDRESALARSATLFDLRGTRADALASVGRFIDRTQCPTFILSKGLVPLHRPTARIEVPGTADVYDQIQAMSGRTLNGELSSALRQFPLKETEVPEAAARMEAGESIWDALRSTVRTGMEGLAERVHSKATWNDLVLPDATVTTLKEIVAQLRHRHQVFETWGMGRTNNRGTGLATVFAGPTGTGKSLAAEVIANEMSLDLYRIDLSSMVSKYIGETEKNLEQVFARAERGGSVLLFDEADALFGKRSEVKDSHDRYANLEVSFLLQRMEAYRGLAILTTNLKGAIDPAFMRRVRYLVNFPFPDAALRAEIWRRAFPPDTPTQGLDFERLAKLNVAGGHIRNIALGAAFLAAEAEIRVDMRCILRAARTEATKFDRPLNDAEVAGWA